jgi:ABC-type branched-subunit amino acid transport system substrate-binding protein
MSVRAFACFLLWAGFLAGCGRVERRVRIITLTNLTGPQALFGDGIRTAGALALKEQQAALENAGWRVELTSYDDRGSAQDLAAIVTQIAAQTDVACAVVHTSTSGNTLAIQILRTAGIPTVLPAETAPVPDGFSAPKTVWLSPDDRAHGAGDAGWMAANDYTQVFVLGGTGEHALNIQEGFLLRAEALGLRVTQFQYSAQQNPPAWILAVQSASPQLVYYSGSSDSILLSILLDLESSGFHGSFFYAESEAENRLPERYSSQEITLFFSPAAAHSEDFSRPGQFAEKYREAYATDPPPLSALGFDAVTFCLLPLLGVNAADPSGSSPRAGIIAYWQSAKAWEGVSGIYSFGGERPCRTWVYTQSKDSTPVWIPALLSDPAENANPVC